MVFAVPPALVVLAMVVGIGGGDDGWRSYVVASVVGSGIANSTSETSVPLNQSTSKPSWWVVIGGR